MQAHANLHYVIETHALTRRFETRNAVDGIDLRVPASSIYGFLGPNGAGKTTTIRMLLGLIRPTSGDIKVYGYSVPKERVKMLEHVGAMVESPSLYPHLSGRENLEVTRRLCGSTQAQVNRALSIVGLEKDADRLVRTYSLGMRQRLGIGLALLRSPDLLILDEPTNGLDPAGIHEIRALIHEMPERYGITVFISSHLLAEVEQLATHVGIINHGKLIYQGELSELQASNQPVMVLGVEQPEEVLSYLSASGWKARSNGSARLYVEVNGISDVALINTQLVRSGWNVTHLTLEQPNLEDVFLTLTGQPA